jgi:hypothetical protein
LITKGEDAGFDALRRAIVAPKLELQSITKPLRVVELVAVAELQSCSVSGVSGVSVAG